MPRKKNEKDITRSNRLKGCNNSFRYLLYISYVRSPPLSFTCINTVLHLYALAQTVWVYGYYKHVTCSLLSRLQKRCFCTEKRIFLVFMAVVKQYIEVHYHTYTRNTCNLLQRNDCNKGIRLLRDIYHSYCSK